MRISSHTTAPVLPQWFYYDFVDIYIDVPTAKRPEFSHAETK
jgi:hypothetical protein